MAKSISALQCDIDDPRYRTTPVQQMAAACTGALLTSLFITPLDVVKIRLQAQQKAMSKCFLYCNGLMDHLCVCNPLDKSTQKTGNQREWMYRNGHFSGTIDAFVKITKQEGVTSLWSGLSPTLVLAVPATIIYFVTYENLRLAFKDRYNKNRLESEKFQQPFWIPLAAGGTARVFSVTVVSPLELIRTKMQSQKLSYLEIGVALRSLIQSSGIRSLWKGLTPTLLRDVPFSAIYWMNYEMIKNFISTGVPSFSVSFVAGAFAGGVAAAVTCPFDVVKTHQQIELGEKELNTNKPVKAQRTSDVIKEIFGRHGYRGFFTGLAPRLIKVAPACAIMIGTFEQGKLFFNRSALQSTYPHPPVAILSAEVLSSSAKQKDKLGIIAAHELDGPNEAL